MELSFDELVVVTLLPFAWALTLVKAHNEFIEDMLSEIVCD